MGHVGFQESIPAIPFWNLKYPIPNRSLRAAVPSASSALHSDCIMPIPSLQMQKKVEKACLMQRSRGFGHAVLVSKICYNASDCPLSCATANHGKPMNSCRD